jgi:hypothetical protein
MRPRVIGLVGARPNIEAFDTLKIFQVREKAKAQGEE